MLTFISDSCNYFILICAVLGIHFYLKVHGRNKVKNVRLKGFYDLGLTLVCVLGIAFWLVWFWTSKFI